MRARDPELDHLGAEVVEVAAERAPPGRRARGSRRQRCVDGRRRAHPQRVEVVGDRRRRSGTRSGSGSRSSCGAVSRSRRGAAAPREVALGDVGVDERELVLDALAELAPGRGVVRPRAARNSRSAASRLSRSTGSRAARARVGGGQRVVQRVDRGGDRVRVVALEEQEARDRAARSAAPAPRAGRPGSRRPPAAARAPGRRARGRRPRRAGGSATRSIRSTMSAASIAAPASQERAAPRRAASCGSSRPRTARSAR